MPKFQDRGRHGRVPFFRRVDVRDTGGGGTYEACSFEISLWGVSLICRAPLPLHQPVCLDFHLNGSAAPQRATAFVTGLRVDGEAAVIDLEFRPPLGPSSSLLLARAVERL